MIVNNEFGRLWNEIVATYFKVPSIFLDKLRNTTKKVCNTDIQAEIRGRDFPIRKQARYPLPRDTRVLLSLRKKANMMAGQKTTSKKADY
jgi:hypothetical protein